MNIAARLKTTMSQCFFRVLLRSSQLVGKERSLWLLRRFALASRKLAGFAHLCAFRVHWDVRPEPEWQDTHTTMYTLWERMQQPFMPERGSVNALAIEQDASVLDICCGDGYYTYYFHSGRAKHVMGVDFDPVVIQHAQRFNSAPNITYRVCDIRRELPEGPFDNVIWNGAIEHFTPEEITAILSNIRQRLRPGGIVSGWTIAALPGIDKQLSHHEYEFQSKEDLLRFFTPHFRNAAVFESVWPARPEYPEGVRRHNLYFFASDASIPFSEGWRRMATSFSLERKVA